MDFSVFLDFDKAIFQWVEQAFNYGVSAIITPFLKFFTVLGDNGYLWIALAILLLCFKKTRKIGATIAAALAVMMLCNNIVLKNIFARPRPYNLEEWKDWFVYPEFVPRLTSYSFPSGHSSSAFAAATALCVTKKAYCIIPAYLVATIIAFSRIWMHVHYPTDVIFGALLGVIYGVIGIFLCKWIIGLINDKTKLNFFREA